MARTVTTGGGGPLGDGIARTFAQWRTLKAEAATIKIRQDQLRDRLLVIAANGESDAKGHRHYEFGDPVNVGGKTYRGIKREVRKSTVLDEDLATERLKEKGVYEEALFTPEPELSQNQIYALYAEGKLTGDDIDYMFVTTETYALKEEV